MEQQRRQRRASDGIRTALLTGVLTCAFGCSAVAGSPVAGTSVSGPAVATAVPQTATATPEPDRRYEYPSGADEVVISLSWGGGLVPASYAWTHITDTMLLGDGTLVSTRGVDQLPGGSGDPEPAFERANWLQPLQSSTLDDETIQRLLRLADDSGLLVEDLDFGWPGVYDAGSAGVEINVDGRHIQLSASALGLDDDTVGENIDAEQVAARQKLRAFMAAVGEAAATAPLPYLPHAVVILRMDPESSYQGDDVDGIDQAWPIRTVPKPPGGSPSCVEVTGDEVGLLADALSRASVRTQWLAGSQTMKWLVFRPKLPDDEGCERQF